MKKLLWALCVFCLHGCQSRVVDRQEDFMILDGPLTKDSVRSSGSGAKDAFDCSYPVPPGAKRYFEYLQSRGVTHFKVPLSWAQLLPTGVPSQAQQDVVTCYQTLLGQLLEAGLQPLVSLHGSTVPASLGSRYGGWESQKLVEMFQQYAEFAFEEFGALAHSWVTLSDLGDVWRSGDPAGAPGVLQNIHRLSENIYRLYHQRFPDKGESSPYSATVVTYKVSIAMITLILKCMIDKQLKSPKHSHFCGSRETPGDGVETY